MTALAGSAPLPRQDHGFAARLESVRSEIDLPPAFRLLLGRDHEHARGRYYFQIACERPDTFTGQVGEGRGGKAYLSRHATDSELVQAAFGLYRAYVEHEARETFLWRGRRVFGPHISTAALWEVAERYDARA